MSAHAVATALGGKSNGDGYVCPCPVPSHGKGRGDRNPSLTVRDGPGGLVVHCFCGCDWRDIKAELSLRGLHEEMPRYWPRSDQLRQRPSPRPIEPDRIALDIWAQSEPLNGTIAEQYLWRRGITLRPPALCHHNGRMIAAVTVPYRGITAIQITPIKPDHTRGDRITKGPLGTGAVRLGAAQRIMGVAEGTETALAAMILSGMPVWASLGSKRLHSVELPPIVEEAYIFSDNDAPGQEAAEKAAKVHTDLGRRVEIRRPPVGFTDFNDWIIADADAWQKDCA